MHGPVSYRVFIVDDDPSMVAAFSALLEALGHEVGSTTDGRSAVSLIDEFRPQYVFLDLVMPGFSGFDIFNALRQVPELQHTKFVALSGLSDHAAVQSAINGGWHGYLVKPASGQLIAETMERLAGSSTPVISI